MDHTINETELVPRKQAKLRFRESILYEWDYCCAYCGDPLGKNATLDHVMPKSKGGLTTQKNLVGCCFSCNSHKSGHDWIEWYRQRDYWLPDREERIARWLEQ
jgi:5-methylcytosine-specific restriction endonuclease McrA